MCKPHSPTEALEKGNKSIGLWESKVMGKRVGGWPRNVEWLRGLQVQGLESLVMQVNQYRVCNKGISFKLFNAEFFCIFVSKLMLIYGDWAVVFGLV
ncbi:hypothetical protein VNO80_23244 [Phaseolus coccineus]|uniref:Uncharacterized protein n=1 Tax=Phaseolus coccineus TaxID=3886 RepID=A0AAN9QSF1_PHACN